MKASTFYAAMCQIQLPTDCRPVLGLYNTNTTITTVIPDGDWDIEVQYSPYVPTWKVLN